MNSCNPSEISRYIGRPRSVNRIPRHTVSAFYSPSPFLHFIMFRKQQGNGNKVLQGNKDRLMRRGPLTRKHSNMWSTFKIQMEKNCFLAIKASCSPASQPDVAVNPSARHAQTVRLLFICLFVCLLTYFSIVLFYFDAVLQFSAEKVSRISLPGLALQCTLGVTAGHWNFNTIWK